MFNRKPDVPVEKLFVDVNGTLRRREGYEEVTSKDLAAGVVHVIEQPKKGNDK